MSAVQTTSNKQLFKLFLERMNTNDPDVISETIDEFVAPDAVIRTPLPLRVSGAAALKEVFETLRRAYPDIHVEVDDMIAERDKVVGRNTVTGTHRGVYMGIEPTGKSVTYEEIFIFRFENGRVVETWGVVDVLAQLRQIGAVR